MLLKCVNKGIISIRIKYDSCIVLSLLSTDHFITRTRVIYNYHNIDMLVFIAFIRRYRCEKTNPLTTS